MVYKISDYSDLIKGYRSGQKQINISSTTLVFSAFVKIIADVVKSLNIIQAEVQSLSFENVRNFIVNYS